MNDCKTELEGEFALVRGIWWRSVSAAPSAMVSHALRYTWRPMITTAAQTSASDRR